MSELSPTGVAPELILFLKVLMTVVAITGTFGNILTIVSIATNKPLRTAPNAYVVNLAITDLIVCSCLIPCSIVFYDGPPSEITCKWIGYPSLICMVVSIFNLSLIALNRYIAICKSRDLYIKLYTKRNILLSCLFAWGIVALAFSPPFFGLGKYGYNLKFGTCFFITNDPETYWMVFGFADCTVVFPTLFLTLFCYGNIIMMFRASQKKVKVMGAGKNKEQESNSNEKPNAAQLLKEQKEKESNKKMLNVIKSLFVIWVTFLCFWMPLIMTYKIDYYSSVPNTIYHILFGLAQSNSTVNFLLYAMTNKAFVEAYKRTLTCGRKGKVTPG